MEKLTLEHLAPYLPYGLKIKINEGIATLDMLMTGGSTAPFYFGIKERIGEHNPDRFNIKPILRPLRDLGKQAPRTVVGRRYIDEINTKSMYHMDACGDFEDLPEIMEAGDVYGSIQGLFQNHFDLFGLIKADLAIDINTL